MVSSAKNLAGWHYDWKDLAAAKSEFACQQQDINGNSNSDIYLDIYAVLAN